MKDDDSMLERLGAAARDTPGSTAGTEDEPAPIWDRFARGEIAADDPALRASVSSEEEYQALLAAFAPLSDHVRERIGGAVRREMEGPRSRRARVWSLGAAGAATLALAAVILLTVWPRDASPLAPYQATVIGGVSEMRGDPSGSADVPHFRAASRLEIRLRPEARTYGEIDVRAHLETTPSVVVPWSPSIERSEQGAMRLSGTAGELFDVPSGPVTLVFRIGRPDAPAAELQVLRVDIHLDEDTR